MARLSIPDQLKGHPITIKQAEAAGLTRDQLRGSQFKRLGRGLYAWVGFRETPDLVANTLLRQLPPGCVLSGLSAAKVYGLDIQSPRGAELTAPPSAPIRTRPGMIVHRARLQAADITRRRGLMVTTPLRTCFDLLCSLSLVEAVVAADAMLHQRLVRLPELVSYTDAHAAFKGVRQARRVARLADAKAESPMESRLRMVMVEAGLPRPEVQQPLMDENRVVVARPDLSYPAARLGIEYDGATHRESLAADNRRQNILLCRVGVVLLRYTAFDVYHRPATIVEDVRSVLAKSPIASKR